MISIPSTHTAGPRATLRPSRSQRAAPAFTVEIPELDDAAIDRLAEVLISMLDTLEHEERTPGGAVPTGNAER
jgi:hypothetical protein